MNYKPTVFTGNSATGYTTNKNGANIKVYSELNARRMGTIKGAVPDWAKCCGWNKK